MQGRINTIYDKGESFHTCLHRDKKLNLQNMLNSYSGITEDILQRADDMTQYVEQDTEQELVKSLLQKKGFNFNSRPQTQQNSSFMTSQKSIQKSGENVGETDMMKEQLPKQDMLSQSFQFQRVDQVKTAGSSRRQFPLKPKVMNASKNMLEKRSSILSSIKESNLEKWKSLALGSDASHFSVDLSNSLDKQIQGLEIAQKIDRSLLQNQFHPKKNSQQYSIHDLKQIRDIRKLTLTQIQENEDKQSLASLQKVNACNKVLQDLKLLQGSSPKIHQPFLVKNFDFQRSQQRNIYSVMQNRSTPQNMMVQRSNVFTPLGTSGQFRSKSRGNDGRKGRVFNFLDTEVNQRNHTSMNQHVMSMSDTDFTISKQSNNFLGIEPKVQEVEFPQFQKNVNLENQNKILKKINYNQVSRIQQQRINRLHTKINEQKKAESIAMDQTKLAKDQKRLMREFVTDTVLQHEEEPVNDMNQQLQTFINQNSNQTNASRNHESQNNTSQAQQLQNKRQRLMRQKGSEEIYMSPQNNSIGELCGDTDSEERLKESLVQYKHTMFKNQVRKDRERRINHRQQNPQSYSKQDDEYLFGLLENTGPRMMFGSPGQFKIPNFEKIKEFLIRKSQPLDKIVEMMEFEQMPADFKLKSLSIMKHEQLLTSALLNEMAIKNKDDKVGIYIQQLETSCADASHKHGGDMIKHDIYNNKKEVIVNQLLKHENFPFMIYVKKWDEKKSLLCTGLIGRLQYYKKCKDSNNPRVQMELANDPHYRYFMMAQHSMTLAFPILEQVHNGHLYIYDVVLSDLQAEALIMAANFFDNFVKRIVLDNNHLVDKQLSRMIESFTRLRDFKSLIVRKNAFDMECVKSIAPLILKRRPYNLDELKISNCKTSANAIDTLLELLCKESYIDKLCLQGITFSNKTMPLLCQFIEKNKYICNIDISWNRLTPDTWKPFLMVLRKNKKLKKVNLSWNYLVEHESTSRWAMSQKIKNDKKKGRRKKKMRIPINIDLLTEDEQKIYYRKQQRLQIPPTQLFVADCLSELIKYNQHLHHLDVSGCGLSDHVLLEISLALRKSRSMVGIHLSNNPGLSQEVKAEIMKRAHCKPEVFESKNRLDLKKHEINFKNHDKQFNDTLKTESIVLAGINKRKRAGVRIDEVIGDCEAFYSYKDEKEEWGYREQRFEDQEDYDKNINQRESQICVISRFNGHKNDLNADKPGQWKMHNDESQPCWICDKQIYSLVFFNPTNHVKNKSLYLLDKGAKKDILDHIKKINSSSELSSELTSNYDDQSEQPSGLNSHANLHKITRDRNCNHRGTILIKRQKVGSLLSSEEEERLLEKTSRNSDSFNASSFGYEDEDEDISIYGSFTNWKKQKMIPLLQFVENIDKNIPDFIGDLKMDDKISQEANTQEDLNEEEMQEFYKKRNKYRRGLKIHWQSILTKNLPYKSPNIMNLSPDDLSQVHRLYVYVTFIQSGKHHYAIQSNDSILGIGDWQFYQEMVNFRTEGVQFYTKQLKSHFVKRRFNKENSMFDSWEVDNEFKIDQCIEHDFSLNKIFKLQNLRTKPGELEKLQKIIRHHYLELKEISIYLQSTSKYPNITLTDFNRFCQNLNFMDAKTNSSRVDQLYLSSNLRHSYFTFLEETDQGNKASKNPKDTKDENEGLEVAYMRRSSFIEFLIRLAQNKYMDRTKKVTYAEALEKLLGHFFLRQNIGESWQSFRTLYIWTLEVDDLLQANYDNLDQIFYMYADKGKISLEQCIQLFQYDTCIALAYDQIKFCFGMSKMSVSVDSLTSNYTNMEFVEFLEMICRVADVKFRQTEIETEDLHLKVGYILDDLVLLLGESFTRVQADHGDVEISESDEDY